MPKILPIIINPDPILRRKSSEINFHKTSPRYLQGLCLDMAETMVKKDGVGLAAPQIGKNIRLITVNTKDGAICLISPKITKKSWAKKWNEEGCLSVPGIFGQVRRHKKIKCAYFDSKGKKINIGANGLMAGIIQHEIDHLDGILFIDKARGIKKVEQ